MRQRTRFLLGGSLVILAALFATDPDNGISTAMLLLGLATPVIAVAFAHFARKALFDYPESDVRTLFSRARTGSTGAGLALVAIAIVVYGLLALFGRAAHAQVPQAAHQHLPTLSAEIRTHWPDHPMPAYFGGLIEHESCITLTHPRCWSATSRLKSAREEGAGLGQITRAYHPDGTLRFDALTEMRMKHPALREWSWANVYQRPDLQLRAVVLMSRDNWQALDVIPEWQERLAMADAAYNGGLRGLDRDRRACVMTADCDAKRWWGNVERTCTKSRAALYGSRSACDINRWHVADVIRTRAPKYRHLIA